MKIQLLILSMLLCTISCKYDSHSLEEEKKLFPSDFLFQQRSYPYGKIDNGAILKARKRIDIYKTNRKSKFENEWESKGPFLADGRVTDLEVDPNDDNIVYAGTASGGIAKSFNSGINWEHIFDDQSSLSIGDMAIYKKNSDIIYVGTGESNAGGGSLAYDGTGVFKSLDGGESWEELGPNNIGSIGRVQIDPNNPDVVYVAAMGELFNNNPERGVFKTANGGQTWQQVLMVSDSTGAIDLVIHPNNGNIVYAAMWERIRKVDRRAYGGATSGIYKTTDGGVTWEELRSGLPINRDEKGRIGLAIAESNPEILYAYYTDRVGFIWDIYKTTNGGSSWERLNQNGIQGTSFGWWFGKIFVDPNDADRVFTTSLNMFSSQDGGRIWNRIFSSVHVDQHAVAISQQNSGKVYLGNDGGVYLSENYGVNVSRYLSGLNNFQFYTCTIDPLNPDVIYGGAQDNGTWRIVEGSNQWEFIFGGDGFRVLIDPNNPNLIYAEYQNGNIVASTNGGTSFVNATFGLDDDLFNWNTPIAMDPDQTTTLYTGGQRLYRSTDSANRWIPISPILTENIPAQQDFIKFGTLTTIDVSTIDSDVIYIGTDEGSIWVTKDYGLNYENISSGLPKRWITSVQHDPFSVSGVYVTVSGFRFGESGSQVFYSSDYGSSWISIAGDLPDVPVNDIIVDPDVFGTLYVATDVGVFYTENSGDDWFVLGNNLPNVVVTDLDIHSESRILAAASYGKGMLSYQLPMSTSSDEITSEDFNIYPNPTSDLLYIQSDKPFRAIELLNNVGSSLLKAKDTNVLGLSHLPAGIYYVKVIIEDSEVIKTIVKI